MAAGHVHFVAFLFLSFPIWKPNELDFDEIHSTSVKQTEVEARLENKEHQSTKQLKKEETEKWETHESKRTNFTNSIGCLTVSFAIAASGSLSLTNVFVLLLILFFRDATSVFSMFSALDVVAVVITMWKFRCTRDLENRIRQLQEVLQEEGVEDIVSKLMEHKKELDDHKDHLKSLVAEMETKRERNKQKLQLLENNITEGEPTLEELQELLKQKESALQAQWKLEQTKNINETQLLHTDRLLELIEIQVNTVTCRYKELND